MAPCLRQRPPAEPSAGRKSSPQAQAGLGDKPRVSCLLDRFFNHLSRGTQPTLPWGVPQPQCVPQPRGVPRPSPRPHPSATPQQGHPAGAIRMGTALGAGGQGSDLCVR